MKCPQTYVRLLLSAFVLTTSLWAGKEFPAKPGEEVVPNQLLVRYKSGTAGVSVAAMMLPGAQALPLPNVPNVYVVQVPANAPAYYSTQLSQDPLVEYVEPNRIRHIALANPSDSLFGPDQWDLTTIQAVQAWQLMPGVYLTSSTAGAGRIKVAVIDTGADCTHPDFANAGGASLDAASGGQILFSASEGIVPTTHSPAACAWQDDNGHGTHTSGTVAAATNNARGVAALGYPLELIEYKAMSSAGTGTDADLSTAIHHACDAGASIISMSVGEPQYSQTLQDAVNYAWQRNCLVVAAAGNNNANEVFFPASANHAMGVAATTNNDSLASFSNFGVVVDVAAPGVGIWSTIPTYSVPLTSSFTETNGSYGTLDGTSMATPHVSALAGLIEMTTPNLSVAAVAQRIEQSADATDLSAPSGGWGQNQGYGRINASRAISGNLRSASVGGIVGQVVNASGVPISGATVNVTTQGTFITDSTGLFRYVNFAAGQTVVVSVTSASGNATVNAAIVAGADTNVTVVVGVTTGTFTGMVSDGVAPLAGVVVQALNGGLIQATASTDAGGIYSLVVPAGSYDLRASAMYAVTTTVSGQVVTASGSTSVPIQMARMGNISGTVKDASNNAVAGAILTIAGSGYSAGAVADANGAFSTIPLPAGTYNVTATRASPAFSATLTGVVVTNDETTVANFGQNVTVTTSPAGMQVIVDGATLTAPQSFNWVPGSAHTLNVPSPQTVGGTRGTFVSWSDGQPQSHGITAPASGSTASYTATFTAEYLLTLAASPAGGGTVTPTASPTNDGFYPSGTLVTLTAAANPTFIFGNFTSVGAPLNLPGATNPNSVTMSAPTAVTANFGGPTSITVTTNPPGLQIKVDNGAFQASPQVFSWAAGSQHTVAVNNTQSTGPGARYAFVSWSDGGAVSHQITVPATTTTYTASFNAQFQLTLTASPGGGGTVTPNPLSPTGDGYYNTGTGVSVTAAPNAGFGFSGFSGDLAGATNPQTVTMTAPHSVTANFGALVNVAVNANVVGLSVSVDGGAALTGTQNFIWAAGSHHTLLVASPQNFINMRATFVNWSDGATTLSDAVTAPAGGSITYTANFNVSYLLLLTASPTAGGTVTANPASPTSDGFYPSGTIVKLTAAANDNYTFTQFSGDLTGPANPQSVTMSTPHAVTANFNSLSSGGPLAANWNLNESSGATSFADTSGNGHTGFCSGPSCPTLGVPGSASTAASFNGTNSLITVPDSPSLRLNQFTIALWVYPRQVKADYQPLLAKEDAAGANRNYGLYIAPNTMQVRYAVWGGDCATHFAGLSASQLALNSWSHIAFTYDGAVEKLYINGVLDSSSPASSVSLCQVAVPVKIGKETSIFQPFNGNLDGIQIYNQPLNAASVSSLYQPLAASWKLDEPYGSTSFADASGNGNTGSCSGSSCPTMGVPGKKLTAASFNGANSQITIPDSPSLRLDQFTIALWVYPSQVKSDYQPLLAKEDSVGANRNYGLFIAPNTMQVRYSVWASDCSTRFAANSVSQLALNTWNYVVFTYDGATASLYINGVLDSSSLASTPGGLCHVAVPVRIGKETSVFQPFFGNLDDIQIYNQALSAATVSSLYSPLAASWKLDEPSGATSFADASGNGNIGACSSPSCPTMGLPGKAGTAASFNGINDQITIPDSPSLRLNQFTIALWVYPTQLKGDFQPLLAKEDSSGANRNYGLYIAPSTMQVRYAVWASNCTTRFSANSVGQLALNTWNYVVFTYDGATESLYINGVLDSSNPASTPSLCQAAVPVNIGKETSVFQPFVGNLDNIQIYGQALSAAAVSSLYSSF